MLWAMLHNHPVHTCFYLIDYLDFIGTRPAGKGDIVVGGIITYIARCFGVGEDEGIKPIEGNNRLNRETLIAMNFIKHRPPLHYQLKLNVPIMFLLPNPSRTTTEVEENLLHVDDVQVLGSKMMMKEKVLTCTMMWEEVLTCTKRSTMAMTLIISMKIKDGHGSTMRLKG
jgi:hypothetical protein